jgi:hypothetical protein
VGLSIMFLCIWFMYVLMVVGCSLGVI